MSMHLTFRAYLIAYYSKGHPLSDLVIYRGKGSKKGKEAFRKDYGSLLVLRSFSGGKRYHCLVFGAIIHAF